MSEPGKTLGTLCNELVELLVRTPSARAPALPVDEDEQRIQDQAAAIRADIDRCLTRTLRGATTRGLGLSPDEVAEATRIGDLITQLVFIQREYLGLRREGQERPARATWTEARLQDLATERARCIVAIDDKLVRMARPIL